MSTTSSLYIQPTAMEPLLPSSGRPKLAELTTEIFLKAGRLSGQLPASIVRQRIAVLISEMNSYYSNLIEGHKTLPKDIERAMREDYSSVPEKRNNQLLNRAHIQVEGLMRQRLEKEPDLSIHTQEFICWLHREFYSRLPEELHWSEDRHGKKYRIEPGTLRSFEVEVGRHQPPQCKALSDMLARFSSFYDSDRIPATNQLIALAAAHHRLAWIHPFGDGNGRVTRLYSHAWLIRCKVDSLGLWTLSRGFARHRKEYFERLREADNKRRTDYDGRGNLSDCALAEFCLFVLQTMLDQISFMSELLDLHNLNTRIEHHLQFVTLKLKGRTRDRLGRLLKAALIEGKIERGRVGEILGVGSTVAREIINVALREKLLDFETEKGPLSLVFSSQTLESYFPKLCQDLPVETSP